eukprot:TRINITY_DN206_c1_g2_i12.p1 TRINITY_DN206_c1_g2~~TRINITY_DN206_c1_g2_i12.p1  ORF type:complete len:134 (+),score=8.80 TRINITY_DN206_c1_g2_i12:177-578(+)
MDVRKVLRLAVCSRCLVWSISIITTLLVDPYDTSAHLAYEWKQTSGILNKMFQVLFGPFANWDAIYFVGIAKMGYKYEQFHAFFPLLPWLMRFLGYLLFPLLGGTLSEYSLLLFSGFLVSHLSFVLATVMLFQ